MFGKCKDIKTNNLKYLNKGKELCFHRLCNHKFYLRNGYYDNEFHGLLRFWCSKKCYNKQIKIWDKDNLLKKGD